jgi:hypothetical protein
LKRKKSGAKRQTPKKVPVQPKESYSFVHSFWGGIAAAVLGIVIGQAILYGPSLTGKKILLPLDLLAVPGSYLPVTEETRDIVPHNITQSDLIFGLEPVREGVNHELLEGRAPLWTPYMFAGAPAFRVGLSPPWLLAYLIKSPVVLAWAQMFVALIAGLGMFYFCRRILGLGPWPSLIAAWCYPLTGAYVLWVGQWLPAVMCWLPWSLAAVDRAVRAPRGWGGPVLGLITVVLLLGGAIDIGGQILLITGLYSLWCIWDEYGSRAFSLKGLRIAGILTLAWVLGFACSMWLLAPARDYAATGSRMIERSSGSEERPPIGIAALPQIVIPDIYGSDVNGSYQMGPLRLPESSAMAYAGSFSCLFLAPLAWLSYKRRSIVAMLTYISFFSLSWALHIPLIVPLLRLPGLNMMSHNRMAFVAAFSLLALGAIGLETLLQKNVRPRWWFAIPAILLAIMCIWCIYSSINLPEPIATQLGEMAEKALVGHIDEPWEVAQIQAGFRRAYAFNALFLGAGTIFWCFLMLGFATGIWLVPSVAALLYFQLVNFGYGYAAQTDPGLYFPKIPILERIVAGPPGRIIGFDCIPANLAQVARLKDIRGYDGVDPKYIVDLLKIARNLPAQEMQYAATQFMSPAIFSDQETGSMRIHPILDMLNVRYVIFRGIPPPNANPSFVDTDYWVWINDRVMPRAFVPRRIQTIAIEQARLQAMNRPDFDPREIAYVEQPLELSNDISGTVEIVHDEYQYISLQAQMQTPGLVVLADRWDSGWRAYVNDVEVPILRVNHAIRGVLVNPGASTIRFEYLPSDFFLGLAFTAAGGICLLAWVGIVVFNKRRTSDKNEPEPLTCAD